jgi:hypothetical protein
LTTLVVIVTEVTVEHGGIDHSEVAVEAIGCHPGVQRLRRVHVRTDGAALVRAALAAVNGSQVVGELGEMEGARWQIGPGLGGSRVI